MEEVAEHELVSKEFDAPEEAPKKEKKKYIPPMDHPWRKKALRILLQNKSTVVVLMFDYFWDIINFG